MGKISAKTRVSKL